MAELRRDGPYVWVTWLPRLLVGEGSCEWAGWFRAQHEGSTWQKAPSNFDLAAWQIEHTALLGRVREELESEGNVVFTEAQNRFALRGASATLGGRPDLIAVSGGSGTIIDVKNGEPSLSHRVQVLVYMYAVPRALRHHAGISFSGKVVYTDHEESIPASEVDQTFVDNLGQLIRRLGSTTSARKVPSRSECRFCDITTQDCPERAAEDVVSEGATADF